MATTKRLRRSGSRAAAARPPASPLSLLQTLIDLQTEEAIAVLDRELRHVAVNAAWKTALGFGADVIGRSIHDVFGKIGERFEGQLAAVLSGESVIRTIEPSPGQLMTQVLLTPWCDESGDVAGIISRHQVEVGAGLHARERRLRAALELAQVFAFEIDFRTGVLTQEQGGLSTTHEGAASYEGLLAKLPEHEQICQRAAWARHLETREPLRQEFQAYTTKGELSWRRSVVEALTNAAGEVIGMVGVSQTIDDRKRAELALVAEKEAAQAADRSKSEFLANISHEIRTPLNGVLGLASLLAKSELSPAQSEMVRTIEASAQTLNALMSDVLDLSKIEAGRLELDVQPFAPAETVQHIHRLFAAAAAAKGLDFACKVDPGLHGLALGDQTRLNQILTNLASNAIKFTAAGQVSLAARAEGEGDEQRLVFTVADTGMGIAEDALPRLFERFVQADGSISRSYGGTGLGLAISRNLAQLMGGDIEAVSTEGRGSAFTLTIHAPQWTQDLATVGEQIAAQACLPLDRRVRVLLVEDHPVNRRVVELILGDLVALECAENGVLGLAAYRRQAFDVVLMDMQMPVMDGLEATRAIRALERSRGGVRTPIVMLSANALGEHVRSGAEAGADFHIAKPITADGLIQAVARAVDLPSAAAAPQAARA